jgi:hypothetical protein
MDVQPNTSPMEDLGAQIASLRQFVRRRNNVQKEIKRLAQEIKLSFDRLASTIRIQEEASSDRIDMSTQTLVPADDGQVVEENLTISIPESPTEDNSRVKAKERTPDAWIPVKRHRSQKGNQAQPTKRAKQPDHIPHTLNDKQLPALNQRQEKRQARTGESVVVKENGLSFSEVLRKLKSTSQLQQLPVEVRAMRKEGDSVRVMLKRGEKGANLLKKAISEALPTIQVEARVHEMTLVVKDLDGECTKEEITASLQQNATAEVPQTVKILSLRPAFGGTINATIRVPHNMGCLLIKQSRVRIGWVNCRVREHLMPQRCYRCWDVGHTAQRCQGVDRRQLCFNCHGSGHQAANCTAQKSCGICGEEGHRTGTRYCPGIDTNK